MRSGLAKLSRSDSPVIQSPEFFHAHKFCERGLPALAGGGISLARGASRDKRQARIRRMVDIRRRRNAEAVFTLKYHLVFCPKYRRPVLVDAVRPRLEELLRVKAQELGATLGLKPGGRTAN